MVKTLRRAAVAAAAAALIAVTVPAAVAAPSAHPAAHRPTIQQLVREGKLIARNNCTSGYDSPYWQGLGGIGKYYFNWHAAGNPPQIFSDNGGPHTNYCFYLVAGQTYEVIQQAGTQNCVSVNPNIADDGLDEAGCNIVVHKQLWYIGKLFGGSLVDKYDSECADGRQNTGIDTTIGTQDGCYSGGGSKYTVWYGLH